MGGTLAQKCRDIRDCVAERIGPNRYRTWFGDAAEFQLCDEDRLDVMVDSSFVGNWIANNFMGDLVAAAHAVLGDEHNVDIRIVHRTNGKAADKGPRPMADDSPRCQQPSQRRRSTLRLRGRLEDFVVGASNQLAYATAAQLAAAPGDAFKLVVLHGGCGLGKTHLLQGICNAVGERHPTLQWAYISGEQFTNEYIYALREQRIELFRARYRNADVLVIDDIHFLCGKKSTQSEFLHTFDAIDTTGKAVVLSSDCHPRSIATLSEPLINRLVSGLVVEITPPDFETRCKIVTQRAARLGRSLPHEVIEFIASHITRNVRELEGALYQLIAVASLTREPMSVELARQALAEFIRGLCHEPAFTDIERHVVEFFGVSASRLRSSSRDRTVALARAMLIYLVRQHLPMSYPEIGRELGKRYTTAVMANKRVEQWLTDKVICRWRSVAGPKSMPAHEIVARLEAQLAQAE